jgi:uncharacterized membrane protein (UPF0182 family)
MEDAWRLAVWLSGVSFALMVAAGYWLGTYSLIKSREKYRTGKGYSVNLQGGLSLGLSLYFSPTL